MIFWRAQEYGKAKEAIAETGDGLGKDVVKHFLPRHAVPGNETLQNAIDSHYAERIATALEAAGALGELGELNPGGLPNFADRAKQARPGG